MRKETKKLAHPNFIVSSLEKPIYSTTTISRYCDVGGPDCNCYSVDEKDHHKLGWATSEDFGRNRDYDFDICPDCQKTNCMKCFDEEPLLDTGQCQNQNCVNHRNCSECEEPYFNNRYGDSYCINEKCGKNENNIKHKEGSRGYWVSCDGPDCDSDGWNSEYDNMPEGWHRDEHDRYGDHSTDYCKDCWDNSVCHECKNPYTNEEEEFTNKSVCKTPSCDLFNKCKHCDGYVNEFGNCDEPEDGYGDCWTCRHCHKDLIGSGTCLNNECKAYYNPYDELFGGKSDKVS
jgi:hypothetical protein